MDLEVCWNGVNRGDDSDLLCAPRIPQKRDAPRLPTAHADEVRPSPTQRRITTALEAGPRTVEELMHLTGLSYRSVRSAIDALRRAEHVEVCAKKSQRPGAPVCVYAIRPEQTESAA